MKKMRVALAVPPMKVADVTYNKNAILDVAGRAREQGASLLLTPELSLTGCSCQDLFGNELLLEASQRALTELAQEVPDGLLLVVGLPYGAHGAPVRNVAAILSGKSITIVPKTHLSPAERRYFSPDSASGSDGYRCGDIEIKYASDGHFRTEDGTRLSVSIGGDFQRNDAAADILLDLCSDIALVGARERRRVDVLQGSSHTRGLCLSVSAGMDESGADFLYSGHGIIAQNGELLFENKNVVDRDYLTVIDVDLDRNGCFDDPCNEDGDRGEDGLDTDDPLLTVAARIEGGKVERLPFIPSEKAARTARCLEIFELQSAALARRLSVTGGRLTIGISGGLDSTLALLVAIRAMERLALPRTNITAVTMPCFGTTDETFNNSLQLMQNLGVDARTVPIKDAVLQHFKDIGHDPNDYSVTYENAQARERTQVLMDIANKNGGIVLGTGDLSELALGWCTYNGDHMSMYGVNGGVPKTLVRWIVTSVAEENLMPEATEVLLRVLDTPISPELLPPDAVGKIAQRTEDIVGPYALHDFFLYYTVRYQLAPSRIFKLAMRAFGDTFDGATVKKWLSVFYRRFFNQQFKRNCLPDGVKVGSVGLSPRGDWQMPSDASAALWLADIEAIEV